MNKSSIRDEKASTEMQAPTKLTNQEQVRQEQAYQEQAYQEQAGSTNKKCKGHFVECLSYCSICQEVAKTTFCVDGGNIHLCDMCTRRRLRIPSHVTWRLQFGSVAECLLNKQ